MWPSCDSAATELATSTLSQFLCPWGPPALTLFPPPPPGGPVHVWAGVWDSRREVVGDPMAPLRNPQPAPETSSRSQREPADLAAASKGGGMKGGREAARDQNEITARERGWLAVQHRQEGRWGAAEQDVQGSPTHGCPLGIAAAPTPAWSLEASLCPPAQSPVPSAAPANVPTVVPAKESPFVPPEPPWECQSHFPPTGLPRLHRRFSSSKRSRAGGSCWLGGLDPAAHGMVHSQTFSLFSF